jgi:hypothetical protein
MLLISFSLVDHKHEDYRVIQSWNWNMIIGNTYYINQ